MLLVLVTSVEVGGRGTDEEVDNGGAPRGFEKRNKTGTLTEACTEHDESP
jgi:hypothetical protein